MKSETSNTVINQTTQYLPNGQEIDLIFRYPSSLKIGDQIEVTMAQGSMQLFEPQHEEGYFAFDIEIWDDRLRLHCDAMKALNNMPGEGKVYSFKIREISLFADKMTAVDRVVVYN